MFDSLLTCRYEKARKLKDKIDDIRTTYTKNWEARDRAERQVRTSAARGPRWVQLCTQGSAACPPTPPCPAADRGAVPFLSPPLLSPPPQMATALYFIDKLALRAGHEKDEDEADTVGCCTLKVGRGSKRCCCTRRHTSLLLLLPALLQMRCCWPPPLLLLLLHVHPTPSHPFPALPHLQVENVECVAPHSIKFDFLGKDSIRYENTVEVSEPLPLGAPPLAPGLPHREGGRGGSCCTALPVVPLALPRFCMPWSHLWQAAQMCLSCLPPLPSSPKVEKKVFDNIALFMRENASGKRECGLGLLGAAGGREARPWWLGCRRRGVSMPWRGGLAGPPVDPEPAPACIHALKERRGPCRAACCLLSLCPHLIRSLAPSASLRSLAPSLTCRHAAAPFNAAKKEGDQLFECFDAQDLNVRLKELMDGLSVKARALLCMLTCKQRC